MNETIGACNKREKKKDVLYLVLGIISVIIFLNIILVLQTHVLSKLSLLPKMIFNILVYWLWAVIPIILMIKQRASLTDIGFTKSGVGLQICIGIIIGMLCSVILVALPSLLGLSVISKTSYTEWWQFLYSLLHYTISVGAVEELVFRCFFHLTLYRIADKEWLAIVLSAVLFGGVHILTGVWFSFIITTCIGLIFGFARYKIKHCSTLSLIIAHGVYDFMCIIWSLLIA